MAMNGPILIIEDDPNDVEVITAAFAALGAKNELRIFTFAQQAMDYLMVTEEQPLIILSDIRMPELDGLNFLKRIHLTPYLRKKSIPFIFYTGMVSPEIIDEAYTIGVQGFYKKADNFETIKEQLYSILMYWNRCLHPNSPVS